MNPLIETLNLWGERLLQFAGPMLWQSSLLILVLFALDIGLRRKVRAVVRYTLWLVVLGKLLLPPTLALPTGVAWWLRPAPHNAKPETRQIIVTYGTTGAPSSVPATATPALPPLPPKLSRAGGAVGGTVIISFSLLMWMLFRWRQVARMVRAASPATKALNDLLEDGRRNMGWRRAVRLRLTDLPMSPAVCGLFRPVILLPRALAEQLPPTQLRAVLLHELAHLKRGDVWVNCLQALLQVAYWWNPLLWLANARIRRIREEAVDDAVMFALRDDAETYAPTLIEVAKLAFHRPLATLGLVGIMESRNALRQRIERLVNFNGTRKSGFSILSMLGIAAFTALAVPMGEAPMKTREPLWTAQADYNSQPQKTPLAVASADAGGSVGRGVTTGTGNGVSTLTADAITVNQETRELVAEGNGRGENGNPVLSADKIHHDPAQATDGPLAFDNPTKETTVNSGEAEAKFTFNLTNVSSADVTITQVLTSCGCTVAKLPATPWLLSPGASGQIPVVMNVTGKSGVLIKTLTVNSDKGAKLLTVKANIQPAPNSITPTNLIHTSEKRPVISDKLNTIRLERVSYDAVPLGEVLHNLGEETRKHDPEKRGVSFILNPSATAVGTNEAIATTASPVNLLTLPISVQPPMTDVRLVDILDAIVSVSPSPIYYSIEDDAIVFASVKPAEALHVRSFQIEPKDLLANLRRRTGLTSTNTEAVSEALRKVFSEKGVELQAPKNLFFDPREGKLLVRASMAELDRIEAAIQELAFTRPQVHIKVRFVEIEVAKDKSNNSFEQFLGNVFLTNRAPHNATGQIGSQFTGVLTDPQYRTVLRAVAQRKDASVLAEQEVTTISGRQAQIATVELKTVVNGMNLAVPIPPGTVSTNTPPNLPYLTLPLLTLPFGPMLEVIPVVSADGYTVQMTVIPTVTEFLGYDDPGKALPSPRSGRKDDTVLPLPRYRIRQMTTSAIVWDGQTLVLGCASDQTISKKPDGSLETKDFSDKERKQLLIFVTPTIIDQAGNRVHTDDEMPSGGQTVPPRKAAK